MPDFVPCIQMETDSYDYNGEGDVLSVVDIHVAKLIVVDNAIVYSLSGSAVVVDFPELL